MTSKWKRNFSNKKGLPFVQLHYYLLNSPGWRALSPVSRSALVEIMYVYKGFNNGTLAMSVRTLGDRLGVSKATAARALNDLEEKGFIRVAKLGSFTRKRRLASEYTLTHYRDDATSELPTKDFLRWSPPRSQKKALTVSPEGHAQQNNPRRSRQRDRQPETTPLHGLTTDTHIHLDHTESVVDIPQTHSRDTTSSLNEASADADGLDIPLFLRRVK